MSKYYAPKNFNFWYFFGVLSLVVLVIQLVSGIVLTMHYTNSAEGAFASVEYIMRDVEFGWLIRYIHSTGASAFFIVVYLHMFRGLMYGSYKMGIWYGHLPDPDDGRLHGLRTALGTDVLLGCERHCVTGWCHSGYW